MFLGGFHFSVTRLVLLDERFVFDLVVVYFTLLLRKLHLHLMPFLSRSLMLRDQNILMKLNLLLPLLHTHLYLMLLVLQVKHLISLIHQYVINLLNLQSPAVVSHQGILLLLNNLVNILGGHFILKFKIVVC